MNNILKVLLGIAVGSLITIVVYEEHLKPEAINLAIKDHELTAEKTELQRKYKQEIFELKLQLRKDENPQG